ncbi:hypothetical protein [Maribacter sp. Asnod1-A12]|uniref:hypothetical protein n=1 Tax=Maribacter sp. Asnod1-A12 TaxID=3160576 RepID=UPI003870D298
MNKLNIKIVPFIIVVFLFGCKLENQQKNHLDLRGLKGKVKSLVETEYNIKSNFGEIKKVDYGGRTTKISYNESGYMTEYTYYNQDGSFNNRTTYLYDDNLNEIEVKEFNFSGEIESKELKVYDNNILVETKGLDSKGRLSWKIEYRNNSNGDIQELIQYNQDGKVYSRQLYEYDKNENHIQTVSFNSKENIGKKSIYQYDDKGNRIEWKLFESNGNLISSEKYEYNKKDKKTIISRYGSKNKLEYTFSKSYNEYGDETTSLNHFPPDETYSFYYEHIYDDYNNWIELKDYQNNVPNKIVERIIEYY